MLNNQLDVRVLSFIKLLLQNKEKVSVRKVAKGVWYGHSIRMVHLSIHRLLNDKKIVRNSLWEIELVNMNIKMRRIPLVYEKVFDNSLKIYEFIRVSTKIAHEGKDYFLWKIQDDSMNKLTINDYDIVLIQKQDTAQNWDIVVVIFEESVLVREFQVENGHITLIPHSTNDIYKSISVTENLVIQWVFEKNLGKF